jgi:RNAse (barnase) inhibitor barstar
MSDKKFFPELEGIAEKLGLKLDAQAALPDVVIVNMKAKPIELTFVEVVHSDGVITELRKQALLEIGANMGFPKNRVHLVTAFEDRNSDIFRKRFSELGRGTHAWFRSEPHLFLTLKDQSASAG